jgi:hypothetical protein
VRFREEHKSEQQQQQQQQQSVERKVEKQVTQTTKQGERCAQPNVQHSWHAAAELLAITREALSPARLLISNRRLKRQAAAYCSNLSALAWYMLRLS